MSQNIICTTEELQSYLKNTVSSHRYIHSLGVAATCKELLERYPNKDYPATWKSFEAASFCSLSHDLAREMNDSLILEYCKENSIKLSQEDINAPVLAHGKVSAHIAKRLCGGYPNEWYLAIEEHTVGCANMDSLALALFCADFIEPSRPFMNEERKAYYLSSSCLGACAYRILCDMIDHRISKGFFDIAQDSLAMKKDLEEKHCNTGRIAWNKIYGY